MQLGGFTRDFIKSAAPSGVFVLPVGAVEQHGPHMPVATDIILSGELCQEAADRAAGQAAVFVAPALPYGISNHHKPHAGVFSLSAQVFSDVLFELLTSAFESGFRRAAIVNGHNGNDEAIKIVARELNNRMPLTIAATSYWAAAWKELDEAGVIDNVPRIPGHAGAFETSLMLAMHPEFVQTELVPDTLPAPKNARSVVAPAIFAARSNHGFGLGYSDAPKAATAEFGERARQACVAGLSNFFIKLGRMPANDK
jgi:creatinine amidohydrolase